jgi:hypothetical protein
VSRIKKQKAKKHLPVQSVGPLLIKISAPFWCESCTHTEQTSKSREEDLETFDAVVFHQRALDKHDLPQQRSAGWEDVRVELERNLFSLFLTFPNSGRFSGENLAFS